MKGIIKHSIAVFSVFLLTLSCQKQLDYGPDILQLKSDVASLKSSISTITAQLRNLEASLKAKIVRNHLAIKNLVKLNIYFQPLQLEEAIEEFVMGYNHVCNMYQ